MKKKIARNCTLRCLTVRTKYWSVELREAASIRCMRNGRGFSQMKGKDYLIQYKQLVTVPVYTVAELCGLS